jgi:hypothetical protein
MGNGEGISQSRWCDEISDFVEEVLGWLGSGIMIDIYAKNKFLIFQWIWHK